MTYAIAFERTDILDRISYPAYSVIPADSTPADELSCFFRELDRQGVQHKETERGVYEVVVAEQKWKVQVVRIGLDDDTQELDTAEYSK